MIGTSLGGARRNHHGAPRRLGGERGAGLVEFALIFPIFMSLVLGLFSGGLAYNQKSAMASAAREGARYAATLPVETFKTGSSSVDQDRKAWLHAVANYVENSSEGALGSGAPGWKVCVAYVYKPSSGPDESQYETHSEGASGNASGQCPLANDAPADDKPRVQVTTERDSQIQALFFKIPLKLTTKTITRFEAKQ